MFLVVNIKGKRRRVEGSSAIHAVGYNTKERKLTIYFRSNESKGYSYPKVPIQEVRGLFRAESKGRYYHQVLKKYGQL